MHSSGNGTPVWSRESRDSRYFANSATWQEFQAAGWRFLGRLAKQLILGTPMQPRRRYRRNTASRCRPLISGDLTDPLRCFRAVITYAPPTTLIR